MSRRALLAVLCPVVAVVVVFFAAKRAKNGTPATPGPDTTVITGPLDASGLIDYETALNERAKGTSTPDTNAVVLLLNAMGPKPEGRELPPDVYKWLGTTPPLAGSGYLVSSWDYFQKERKGEDAPAFDDRERDRLGRPWTEADDPKFFAFVTANEKPLAIAAEASRRPDYFHPMIARGEDGNRTSLVNALLPLPQRCREVAYVLKLRVMLRCGERKFDAAWLDVMTMHRLARLIGKGATYIELLVGFAIDSIARNSALRLLEAAPPTAQQALAWRDELAKLPPIPSLAEKVDLFERFTFLDVCQFLRRDGAKVVNGMFGSDHRDEFSEAVAASLPRLDWNKVLRTGNRWFDRLTDALRKPRLAERTAALRSIDAELEEPRREHVAMDLGEQLAGRFIPAVDKVSRASDRQEVQFQTELLAFALAAYHADHKKYPAKLADLVPKYAAAIPDDLYSGKELIYKPTATGYELYSVGPNGIDDGGQSLDDEPRGDDYGVRMPHAKK